MCVCVCVCVCMCGHGDMCLCLCLCVEVYWCKCDYCVGRGGASWEGMGVCGKGRIGALALDTRRGIGVSGKKTICIWDRNILTLTLHSWFFAPLSISILD